MAENLYTNKAMMEQLDEFLLDFARSPRDISAANTAR